ncbi:hypothetical protein [Dehalogenimonas alkenigignens]|jgi:hypothetical protein|uniref:Uncharacterized protein n=1 Tax=Dehalogenimonas alkenigignens TaxID=1217799 RepID=A0A0W0GG44_9CHLR|nr:hypothetical protein [Dehalogenimonas alkenigignens]KTB47527.1 hypothetical protein DEALK_03720 [Dehalogenimonas alkenigignens]PVV83419.1 hypothetical protein DD509_06180 [Dehalogenimonas alkenigignens]
MSTALSRQDALNWLVKYGIIPYWDSIDNKVLFRKADVKKGSVLSVPRNVEEEVWPGLIKILALKNESDCALVRKNVEHLLKEQGKLLY